MRIIASGIIIGLASFFTPIIAQNLVPNSSFEQITSCPNSWVDVVQKPVAYNWYSPDKGTPDMYNTCGTNAAKVPDVWAGYQNPLNGDGYAGIYTWSKFKYREFLAVKLTNSLTKDSTYIIEFSFANASHSAYACFDLGLMLSSDSTLNTNRIRVIDSKVNKDKWNPTTKWATFSTTYKSTGTEQYLFIGNFNESTPPDTLKFLNNYVHPMINGMAYVYIDEVRVEPFYKEFPIDKPFFVDNIYFEFDKAALLEASFEELDKISSYLIYNTETTLTIYGHTDDIGDEAYNDKLSLERAESVKAYFVENGIETTRIKTFGQGEIAESTEGDTEEIRSKNRKVEFILSIE